MKTLKQHYTMSFNARRDHHGTMWELRYRVRVKDPGELGMMMVESGCIDANPVNAGIVDELARAIPGRRPTCARHWASRAVSISRRRISVR